MKVEFSRRQLLQVATAGGMALCGVPVFAADSQGIRSKPIPTTVEPLPVIGMGTWRTFNVGSDPRLLNSRKQIVRTFFERGGELIDSSPMYGSAPDVMGYVLKKLGSAKSLFAAEKVWSPAGGNAREQFEELGQRWGLKGFDLLQIHNLHDWREHLAVLKDMKAQGLIRYIGITTSHGRRHSDLERIMSTETIDFVQLTYNLTHREVQERLLPLALDRKIAVIANRPYDGGYLIKGLKRKASTPEWARKEFECETWADYLLKFIVSHPAITCAIPATSRLEHMEENMEAGRGQMPDQSLRRRMIEHVEAL